MKASSIKRALKGRGKSPQAQPARKLDDLPFLFQTVAGLRIDGKPSIEGLKRKPAAWADLRPNSAWMLGWNFLRAPLPKGKYGKLLLEPRGTGKSTKARVYCLDNLITDRDLSIQYISQNIEMASHRVSWTRIRLKANEDRFGTFETRENWGNESFTIVRSGSSDEPSMIAGGPEKDLTGSHPAIQVWDDVVAQKTNRGMVARRKIIKAFGEALNQRYEATQIVLIGTIWPGHTLYHEIVENYKDDFEILRVGAWGAAYNGDNEIVWGDSESTAINYPWFTKEFLDAQQRTPEQRRMFRGQYLNQWGVSDEDAPFESSMLVEGDVPVTADGKLHPRLAVYMLTDLGQTDRPTQHASETALVVVAIDIDGVVYIVDLDIGRWNSGEIQEKFLAMYHRWTDQGLRYATMETRGPGKDAMYHIPKLAQARGEVVPAIVPVPRSSDEEKQSRIGLLYAPFRSHKIRFATNKLSNPKMFWIDTRGMPCGVAAERLMNYSPMAAHCLDDLPDALADAYTILKTGPLCPEPSPKCEKPKEMTAYEWSLMRASGQLRKRHTILS